MQKSYKQKKIKEQKVRWGVKLWSVKNADTQFSRWLRESRNYTCEHCGKRVEPPTREIQCSHYIGRSEYATRFDPENCHCLCASCHANFENRKQYEYKDWVINRYGVDLEARLRFKKNSYKSASESIYECMKLLKAI